MEVVKQNSCKYCGTNSTSAPYCCKACEKLDEKFTSHQDENFKELAYLDQPNFKQAYQSKSGSFDYELYVEGLHCASCIHLLEKIPEFDSSIREARVDIKHSILRLKVNPEFSLARASLLIHSLGYTAHFFESQAQTTEIAKKENKNLLKKLATAGACAGNMMLFVIPIYSGLEGELKTTFNWLSFFLFLPILLYSGTSFYKGALASLRYKAISVDLPISIALVGGFLLSTANLIRGSDAVYFDSIASFIFLILCARYLLKQTQQSFISSLQKFEFLKKDHWVRKDEGGEAFVRQDEIKKGDRIKLSYGQFVPVDGKLLHSPALFDVAILNGEPLPRCYEVGMDVLAGSKNLSEQAEILALNHSNETHLADLLRELQNGAWKKAKFINLTDRCAQWLILAVLILAAVFFAAYFHVNPEQAFNRSLALIVLACPCALAFSCPLIFNLALKKAQSLGILIKDSNSLEKLLRVKNVFFDKTGTLTQLNLKLKKTEPAILSEELKALILSLEKKSYHPIAFALRAAWPDSRVVEIENLRENLGHGVYGTLNNVSYELVQDLENRTENELAAVLRKNGSAICRLTFDAPLFKDCRESIGRIQNRGYNCFLLSGDNFNSVSAIAKQCSIPTEQSFGNLSPHQKREVLLRYQNTCMIGDGTNDTLALQAADVGIAVKGSTFLNLQNADIYFSRAGLRPFLDLLDLSKRTRRAIIRNLVFSLSYNLIGAILALSGFVSPWLAAILMPISSMLLIVSSLWEFR